MFLEDKNGIKRLEFSNFISLNKEEPIFIRIEVIIILDIFYGKDIIEIELTDIQNFVDNLKKINEGLISSFYFQNLEEQLKVNFKSKDSGIIVVSGFLRDKQYENTLMFNFETYPINILYFYNSLKANQKYIIIVIVLNKHKTPFH